jgi:NADH-quinone oxidoreductase E subunit
LSAIQTVLEKHPNAKRESLIAILQEVQDVEGYLSHEAICRIGEHLKLPSAKVFGVATFYNQFRFVKPGVFKIQLCRGTACHVKGSLKVLEAVKNELKIEPGQTTKDGLFSLEVVACIGACGLAPVVAINGEFHASVTPEAVKKILNSYREKAVQNGQSK